MARSLVSAESMCAPAPGLRACLYSDVDARDQMARLAARRTCLPAVVIGPQVDEAPDVEKAPGALPRQTAGAATVILPADGAGPSLPVEPQDVRAEMAEIVVVVGRKRVLLLDRALDDRGRH